MKTPKTNLYSRLALITSVTLVVGYFVVYAWTTIDPARYAGGATLTSTLLTDIMANMIDLNTRVSNFSFSSGKIGVGLASPISTLHIRRVGGTTYGSSDQLRIDSGVSGNRAELHLSDGITSDAYISFLPSATPTLKRITIGASGNDNDLIIRGDGNVGIGTVSPSFSIGRGLHISGISGTPDAIIKLSETTSGKGNFEIRSVARGTSGNRLEIGEDIDTFLTVRSDDDTGGTALRGNVGIGTTAPSQKLEVMGTVLADAHTTHSDVRYKKDITILADSLNKLLRIRGVQFLWRDADKAQSPQIGVIAQEVEKEFPEAVITNKDGYKSVAYDKLVAPLIEAVKEQQQQIRKLEEGNNELKTRIENLEKK